LGSQNLQPRLAARDQVLAQLCQAVDIEVISGVVLLLEHVPLLGQLLQLRTEGGDEGLQLGDPLGGLGDRLFVGALGIRGHLGSFGGVRSLARPSWWAAPNSFPRRLPGSSGALHRPLWASGSSWSTGLRAGAGAPVLGKCVDHQRGLRPWATRSRSWSRA